MIICNPDGFEFNGVRCLFLRFGEVYIPRMRVDRLFIDVGISGAVNGVDVASYVARVAKYVNRFGGVKAFAVVPDVFGDFRSTLANYLAYRHKISRFAEPLLVLQMFYAIPSAQVIDVIETFRVRHVALPMRMHHDVKCALRPDLCVARVTQAMEYLCGSVEHLHLLGPAKRVLRALLGRIKVCEKLGTYMSIDTSAYHLAPTTETKMGHGGKYMVPTTEAKRVWFERWIEGLEL